MVVRCGAIAHSSSRWRSVNPQGRCPQSRRWSSAVVSEGGVIALRRPHRRKTIGPRDAPYGHDQVRDLAGWGCFDSVCAFYVLSSCPVPYFNIYVVKCAEGTDCMDFPRHTWTLATSRVNRAPCLARFTSWVYIPFMNCFCIVYVARGSRLRGLDRFPFVGRPHRLALLERLFRVRSACRIPFLGDGIHRIC